MLLERKENIKDANASSFLPRAKQKNKLRKTFKTNNYKNTYKPMFILFWGVLSSTNTLESLESLVVL